MCVGIEAGGCLDSGPMGKGLEVCVPDILYGSSSMGEVLYITAKTDSRKTSFANINRSNQ